MTLIRSDRIWLAKVLTIGGLLLTVVNLAILAVHHREHLSNSAETEWAKAETVCEPQGSKVENAMAETGSDLGIHYPIFRSKWSLTGINRGSRGI